MSININDGRLEVGPPDDDDATRQGHARLVSDLAWELECNLQSHEYFDAITQQHKKQLADLTQRVAFLEQLLTGSQ